MRSHPTTLLFRSNRSFILTEAVIEWIAKKDIPLNRKVANEDIIPRHRTTGMEYTTLWTINLDQFCSEILILVQILNHRDIFHDYIDFLNHLITLPVRQWPISIIRSRSRCLCWNQNSIIKYFRNYVGHNIGSRDVRAVQHWSFKVWWQVLYYLVPHSY